MSSADVSQITHVVDAVDFWQLQHFEQKPDPAPFFDGPTYIIDARINGRYHFVTRALERKILMGAGRALAGAAGFDVAPWDDEARLVDPPPPAPIPWNP